jgi:hypothetical protein
MRAVEFALLPLALVLVACHSVRPVEPAQLATKQLPPVVSVTYPDQTTLVLMEPSIKADTLRGLRWGTQDSVVIPLANVKTVDAKVSDPTKTLLLVGTVGLLTATGMFVLLSETGEEDASLRDCSGDAAAEHPEEFPQCQN